MIICRIRIKFYVVRYGPRVESRKEFGEEVECARSSQDFAKCIWGQMNNLGSWESYDERPSHSQKLGEPPNIGWRTGSPDGTS